MPYIYGSGVSSFRIFEGVPEDSLVESVLTSSLKRTNMTMACIGASLSSYTYDADRYYAYGRDQTTGGLPWAFNFNQLQVLDYNNPAFLDDMLGHIVDNTTALETPIGINSYTPGFMAPTFIGRYFLQVDTRYTHLTSFTDADTIFTDNNTGFRYVADADASGQYLGFVSSPTGAWTGIYKGDISIDYGEGNIKTVVTIKAKRANPVDNVVYPLGHASYGEITITKNLNGVTSFLDTFFQVIYTVSEDALPRYYWYNPYAEQDTALASVVGRDFYPVSLIRKDSTQLLSQKGTLLYADQTEAMLSRLKLDMTYLNDAISESPDEADIDDAFVAFAADIDSDIEIEMHYLYEYFKVQHYNNNGPDISQANWLAGWTGFEQWDYNTYTTLLVRGAQQSGSTSYIDLNADHDFNSEWKWAYTSLEVKNGIYNVGTTRPLPTTVVPFVTDIDVDNAGRGRISKTLYRGDTSGTANEEDIVVYRKQLTTVAVEGTDTYAELVVCSPSTSQMVNSGTDRVVFNLRNILDNEDQTELTFLLSRDVVKLFSAIKESALLKRCLRIVIYALVRQKLEWYQTAWFQGIMYLVAFVIIVSSFGQGTEGAMALFNVTAAEVTFTQIFLYLALQVVIKIAISAAFRFIAKELGGDIALIVAAALLIYGGYNMEFFGGDGMAFGGMISAGQALSFATMGMTAATEVITEDYLATLDEHKEWLLESDKQTAELQAEIDAFKDIYHGVDILNALRGRTQERIIVETPTQMYDRMIHMTNLGPASIQAVEFYHDTMLTLPPTRYA